MKTLGSKEKKEFELKEEYDFSHGVRGRFYRPKKISTSMRLDNDILLVLSHFKWVSRLCYSPVFL